MQQRLYQVKVNKSNLQTIGSFDVLTQTAVFIYLSLNNSLKRFCFNKPFPQHAIYERSTLTLICKTGEHDPEFERHVR